MLNANKHDSQSLNRHATVSDTPSASHNNGEGLIIRNFGGRIGWVTRRYCPELSTRLYMYYARLTRTGAIRKRIHTYVKSETPVWFSHMEIETHNRCNGGCAFCPVNRKADPRPSASMTESLFSSIMRQLSERNYSGYLGLFSNNEPLLDSRLEAFAAEAKSAVPNAQLNLSTNGLLLTVERFRQLIPHFDRIVINNYRDKPEMYKNIKAVHDFCRTREGEAMLLGKTLEISLRRGTDVLSSRAGSAPNRQATVKTLAVGCVLPFSQMVVRPDGKVSLCCNDALGRVTLGDLNTQSIEDVWTGKPYIKLRADMAETGRGNLPLCRDCDFVKLTVH